jgi:hypothetical protein
MLAMRFVRHVRLVNRHNVPQRIAKFFHSGVTVWNNYVVG